MSITETRKQTPKKKKHTQWLCDTDSPCFSYFWVSFSSFKRFFFSSKSRECPCHLDEVIRVEQIRNLLSSRCSTISIDCRAAHLSLHALTDEDASSSIRLSTLNTNPPHNPDRSCRSWNRQGTAELKLGCVGGSSRCGNYWALIRGREWLQLYWNLSPQWDSWDGLTPLCSHSHMLLLQSCGMCVQHPLLFKCLIFWLRTNIQTLSIEQSLQLNPNPSSEPRRHSFPDSRANVFEFKTFTTTQDTSLKGGVMQQPVCSPGICFEFQQVNFGCPNTPCVQIGDMLKWAVIGQTRSYCYTPVKKKKKTQKKQSNECENAEQYCPKWMANTWQPEVKSTIITFMFHFYGHMLH